MKFENTQKELVFYGSKEQLDELDKIMQERYDWVILSEDYDEDWNKLTEMKNIKTGEIKYFINNREQ